MTKDSYKSALDSAKAELSDLIQKREEISQRIVRLQQTVSSLEALREEDDAEKVTVQVHKGPRFTANLTDAMRFLFEEYKDKVFTPTEVRNHLISMGVDLSKYAQQMVPIHNTLKRLEQQGEIANLRSADMKSSTYRWISPFVRALMKASPPPPSSFASGYIAGFGEIPGHKDRKK